MDKESANRLLEPVHHRQASVLLQVVRSEPRPTKEQLNVALHLSTRLGSPEIMKILLDNGADVHSVDVHGEPLLVAAVFSGNPKTIQMLTTYNYNINFKVGNAGDTGIAVPLHLAVSNNDKATVDLLLSHGCDTELQDVDGDTALISACHSGLGEIVSLLIAANCNVNATGYNGNSALHHAVIKDYVSIVQHLLAADADTLLVNGDRYTPPMLAAEAGHVICLHLMLLFNAECSAKSHSNETVLHLAAANGDPEMVDIILEGNLPIINMLDDIANTALITATKLGQEKFAIELLKYNPNWHLTGEQDRNVLHWAAYNGLEQFITAFMKELVKDCSLKDKVINAQDCLGNTCTILAAQNMHDKCTQDLLLIGSDVSVKGQYGRNLLQWVCIHGCSSQTFKLITESGVDVNSLDDENNSGLVLAAANRNYDIMCALLDTFPDCKVNVQGTENKGVLHWLAMRGNLTLLQKILETKGCNVNLRDEFGKTPLLICAEFKHIQCFTGLIKYGAEINLRTSNGISALHCAAEAGLQYCVQIALEAGADVNMQEDVGGRSALTLAAEQGHLKVIRMLIEADCDVTLREHDGRTALWYMAHQGHCDMVELLLERGSSTECGTDGMLSSPLIESSRYGHADIVDLLLCNGASVNSLDEMNRNAVHWAALYGHHKILEKLLECGCDPTLRDLVGDTALNLAAWYCHLQCLQLLIPLSNVNDMNNDDGMSCLHVAVTKDFTDGVLSLLGAGADIGLSDQKGDNSLILASIHTTDGLITKHLLEAEQKIDINKRFHL